MKTKYVGSILISSVIQWRIQTKPGITDRNINRFFPWITRLNTM